MARVPKTTDDSISFGKAILGVAVLVTVVILVFFTIGFIAGKLIL